MIFLSIISEYLERIHVGYLKLVHSVKKTLTDQIIVILITYKCLKFNYDFNSNKVIILSQ